MIRIAAHTMAMPQLDLHEGAKLCAAIGFDAIDIICDDHYPCAVSPTASDAEIQRLTEHLAYHGLTVANLTPYLRSINHGDPSVRREHVDGLKRCIRLAAQLGAASMRVWAGDEPPVDDWEFSFARLVDALRELGEFADPFGIRLNVENHLASMALTSTDTARIVQAVGLPNVGILYDPANLFVNGESDHVAAFERQQPHIGYVHVKNVKVYGLYRHLPTLLDEGVVPWSDILHRLVSRGYRGYVAVEYEKRWHPELLPEPPAGLRHELKLLRTWLGESVRSGAARA